MLEAACVAFSKTLLYFYPKYISSYILYYSGLIKIYIFSRRNSLKSTGLYRGINVVVSFGLFVVAGFVFVAAGFAFVVFFVAAGLVGVAVKIKKNKF